MLYKDEDYVVQLARVKQFLVTAILHQNIHIQIFYPLKSMLGSSLKESNSIRSPYFQLKKKRKECEKFKKFKLLIFLLGRSFFVFFFNWDDLYTKSKTKIDGLNFLRIIAAESQQNRSFLKRPVTGYC